MKDGSRAHRIHYAKFARSGYGEGFDDMPAGYVLDTALSNRNRKLWVNPETKHAVVAHKGTTITGLNKATLADIATDAALAAGYGKLTSRFKNAERHAKQVMKAYDGYSFTSVGHSLGGSLATHVSEKFENWNSVTFAAHAPPRKIADDFMRNLTGTKPSNKRNISYSVMADPVGFGQVLGKQPSGRAYWVRPKKGLDVHGLGNFTR